LRLAGHETSAEQVQTLQRPDRPDEDDNAADDIQACSDFALAASPAINRV
jgi:hypothetical protein